MSHLLLLFFAMPAWSGSAPTIPLASLNDPNALQAVQQALNGSFQVTGGTITGNVIVTSGTLVTTSITFPSGVQTGPAPSASGTNIWTGSNTNAAGSTVAVLGYNNWEVMVASGDFVNLNASTITITSYWGNTSSTTYRVEFSIQANTNVQAPFIRMNGDAPGSTNYIYAGHCDNTGAPNSPTSSGAAQWQIMDSNNSVPAGGWITGRLWLRTPYGTPNISFTAITDNNSNTFDHCSIGGFYKTTSAPSKLTFFAATTNKINGHWELWEGQQQQP